VGTDALHGLDRSTADQRGALLGDPAAVHGGVGPVVPFGYSPFIGNVRSVAARLAERVEQLCAITGASRVRLVGKPVASGPQARARDRLVTMP